MDSAKIRSAVHLSFLLNNTGLVIHFLAVVVLSRLLTPYEIGVFSVAAALLYVAHTLRDFGVGQYLVREKTLSAEKIGSALSIAFLMSWTMAAIIFGTSGLLAEYLDEPGVRSVLLVLSLMFVVLPFSSVSRALLRRELNIKPIVLCQLLGTVGYGVSVVALAWLGFSYMSMAWAGVLSVLIETLVIVIYRRGEPTIWPSVRGISTICTFGIVITMTSSLRTLTQRLPEPMLGKLMGFDAVGYFSRANGVILIFNRVILQNVRGLFLPVLAEVRRESEGELVPVYLRAVSSLLCLAWPFYAVLSITAFPLIRVLYGPQWDEAVPVARALCIWGATGVLYTFTGDFLVAVQAEKKELLRQLVLFPSRAIAIYLAIPYGLVGVALAFGFLGICEVILSYRLISKTIQFRMRELWPVLVRAGFVSLISITGPVGVLIWLGPAPNEVLLSLFLSIFSALFGWTIAIFVTRHELSLEITRIALGVKQLITN